MTTYTKATPTTRKKINDIRIDGISRYPKAIGTRSGVIIAVTDIDSAGVDVEPQRFVDIEAKDQRAMDGADKAIDDFINIPSVKAKLGL